MLSLMYTFLGPRKFTYSVIHNTSNDTLYGVRLQLNTTATLIINCIHIRGGIPILLALLIDILLSIEFPRAHMKRLTHLNLICNTLDDDLMIMTQ